MSIFMESTDPLKSDYIYEYNALMLEQQFNDRIMFLSRLDGTSEILDESGQLISLNEGVIAGIMDFIKNIANSIANVIQKCINDLGTLVGTDRKFLSDNEKLIKTGPNINKGDTITNCYHYQKATTDIIADKLRFQKPNVEALKAKATEYDTAAKYAKDTFGEAAEAIDINSDGSIKEQIMNWYRKDLVTLKDTDINPTLRQSMWEYCAHGMNQAIESLKKDQDRLKESVTDLQNALKAMVNNANAETTETKTTTVEVKSGTGTPPAKTQESTFQSTMDMYFNEDGPAEGGPGDDNKSAGGVKINKGDDNKEAGAEGGDKEEKKEDPTKQFAVAIKSYEKAESQLLSAKMTLAKKAYSQYIKILKWYVGRSQEKNEKPKVDEEDKKAVGI